MLNSITIFCGSSMGTDPIYAEQAKQVGEAIAKRGITLVYGGARVGLMGTVADSALNAGGKVIGVMPELLVNQELSHTGLTELHIVADMTARKNKMSQLADAFIALPGGAGTLEEIFEQWTWAQLDIHRKPCAFLNTDGFYSDLKNFLDRTVSSGFTLNRFNDALIFSDDIDQILQQLQHYTPPAAKWQTVVEVQP